MKTNRTYVFQFPSNGKSYPKDFDRFSDALDKFKVSIPFKREIISKE